MAVRKTQPKGRKQSPSDEGWLVGVTQAPTVIKRTNLGNLQVPLESIVTIFTFSRIKRKRDAKVMMKFEFLLFSPFFLNHPK